MQHPAMAEADAGLAFGGVAGQRHALRSGAVTSRELVELSLRRIDRINPQLNALRRVFPPSGQLNLAACHGSRDVLRAGSMSRLYARLIRWLGHYRWFAVLVKHVLSKVDRVLIRMSHGRLSLSGPQMTTMLLTTTGRTSGTQRTVPVYYVRDGNNLVAVYENFGLNAASNWPKNLLADPRGANRDQRNGRQLPIAPRNRR